ncbi:hypothetical protein VMCG_05216 [Cytospora schulzeri]|uniref:DUF6594 domain-containing protein n=1 Tax=Cytospora schulzeri TaxID=448051 RepID=A0A423WQK5_9PEZI|nr:hypothetical protein VMCG_05216 [Valsa malicola]
MSRLEYVATAFLSYLYKGNTMSKVSRDPNVHLFPRSSTNHVACVIVTPLITMMLMMPVIVCNYVVDVPARLAIITLATSLFITSLSLLTNARTVDVAVAGATYATVLVVFIQH